MNKDGILLGLFAVATGLLAITPLGMVHKYAAVVMITGFALVYAIFSTKEDEDGKDARKVRTR